MSGKIGQAQSDWEFLAAFTTEVREIEACYGLEVMTLMSPTTRRGFVSIAMSATRKGEGFEDRLISSYQVEYPNSRAQTMACTLFVAAVALRRQVESWWEQGAPARLRKLDRG